MYFFGRNFQSYLTGQPESEGCKLNRTVGGHHPSPAHLHRPCIRARSNRHRQTGSWTTARPKQSEVASSTVMANGHQISDVPFSPSSLLFHSCVRRSARPSVRPSEEGALMPAAAPAAAASLAPIVSENPPRFLFPSLEPRRGGDGKGREEGPRE